MGNAIARRENNSCSEPDLTQNNYLSEFQVRREWSSVVLRFEKPQLSGLAGVTPQAVTHWYEGTRAPNTATLFNLAQSLPAVRDWVAMRCGIERAVQAKSYDVWIHGLYQIADGSGLDALRAQRAIKILSREDEPERTDSAGRDDRTIDLFTRRRA